MPHTTLWEITAEDEGQRMSWDEEEFQTKSMVKQWEGVNRKGNKEQIFQNLFFIFEYLFLRLFVLDFPIS